MRYSRIAARVLVAALLAPALLPSGGASAAVGVGHSGWYWGNPTPQGVGLKADDFNGARGYAAGDFGVVMRSDDGGATWGGLPSGTTTDLQTVQSPAPDSVVVGGKCILRRSDDGGRTFRALPFTRSQTCDRSLAAFRFVSVESGFLVLDDGSVLGTQDGGDSYSGRKTIPSPGTQRATDVGFAPPGRVVVATGGTVPGVGGSILISDDAAATWTVAAATPASVRGVTFADGSTGYAVGDAGLVLKTVDGGTTWSQVPGTIAGPPRNLTGIRCADASTCVITQSDGAAVIRTADGGTTLTPQEPATPALVGADFAGGARVVGVGAGGAIGVSDDAGATFARLGSVLDTPFSRVEAGPNGPVAFALGPAGALARTNDGGRTWQRVNVSATAAVRDVSFPTQETGYVLAEDGGLQRTANGGTSYRILDPGGAAGRAVVAPDEKVVLLIGPRGMRRSDDAGATFTAVTDRVAGKASLFSGEAVGGAAFAWGSRTLIASDDGGRRWAKVTLPTRKTGIRAVDFVSKDAGWLLDSRGLLFVTRNRGRKWAESISTGLGGNDPYGLSFSGLTKGYVLTRSAGLLRTSDGGRTWRPQIVARGALTSIAATPGGADVALRAPGELFGTVSGGDTGAATSLSLRTKTPTLGARGGRVTVTGKLSPPGGSESIVVSLRAGGRWTSRTVRVASNGAFTTAWTIRRSSVLVAQWSGDGERRSAGSAPLAVRVAPPKKK
jgi:photosystem II stability/assembly factor-like uncharacterized protein